MMILMEDFYQIVGTNATDLIQMVLVEMDTDSVKFNSGGLVYLIVHYQPYYLNIKQHFG